MAYTSEVNSHIKRLRNLFT